MTHDVETLRLWIRIVTCVAAVCTTAVPVLYSFSPWYRSRLGQLFMVQSISFALATDLTAIFMFWVPKNILVIFWLDTMVLSAVAMSTAALAILMWSLNHPYIRRDKKKGRHAK